LGLVTLPFVFYCFGRLVASHVTVLDCHVADKDDSYTTIPLTIVISHKHKVSVST